MCSIKRFYICAEERCFHFTVFSFLKSNCRARLIVVHIPCSDFFAAPFTVAPIRLGAAVVNIGQTVTVGEHARRDVVQYRRLQRRGNVELLKLFAVIEDFVEDKSNVLHVVLHVLTALQVSTEGTLS